MPNSTSICTPRAAQNMSTFFLRAQPAAAPCVVGEKSSKVTLVAPWTIVFWVRIRQVFKVVVPLNDTRTKRGWGDPVPTGLQRITSSSSYSEEVNPSIIAGTIHVLVSPWRRWWWWGWWQLAADVSVESSGRQAGGLLPHCYWRRQGNRRRTIDNGRQKNVGGRQNYVLTQSWEH